MHENVEGQERGLGSSGIYPTDGRDATEVSSLSTRVLKKDLLDRTREIHEVSSLLLSTTAGRSAARSLSQKHVWFESKLTAQRSDGVMTSKQDFWEGEAVWLVVHRRS